MTLNEMKLRERCICSQIYYVQVFRVKNDFILQSYKGKRIKIYKVIATFIAKYRLINRGHKTFDVQLD